MMINRRFEKTKTDGLHMGHRLVERQMRTSIAKLFFKGSVCWSVETIERIGVWEAIPLLMRQTIVPRSEKMAGELLAILDTLLSEVPVYRMKCTISKEAVVTAYEKMKGDQDED